MAREAPIVTENEPSMPSPARSAPDATRNPRTALRPTLTAPAHGRTSGSAAVSPRRAVRARSAAAVGVGVVDAVTAAEGLRFAVAADRDREDRLDVHLSSSISITDGYPPGRHLTTATAELAVIRSPPVQAPLPMPGSVSVDRALPSAAAAVD